MAIPPLAGFTVAVTADRRAEEQVALLQRRGAEVVLGPTVRTVPLVDDERLASAIEGVIAAPPDAVVLLTGIGTRGMFAAAESMGRDTELADALTTSSVLARGPKAAGAATTVGLDVTWHAPGERASEILDHLRDAAAGGARIAVQRDGQAQPALAAALAAFGADVVDVPVYRWELPRDLRPALRTVDAVIAREVDAVTFTSSPALRHLVSIATDVGRGRALVDALSGGVVAACVGPVCAETAQSLGIEGVVVPSRGRLGAMVQALAAHFSGRTRTIDTASGQVSIQGRAVLVDGVVVALGPRERSLLEVLAGARGAVVPKPRLLRALWGPEFDDEHAVEVAVGRLRRGLGPVGVAVETVPRRGYRFTG